MTLGLQVAVAPNFHLPGAAAGRVLVAGEAGWRSPSEGERPAEPPGGLVLLFALPGHLRASFWGMMGRAEAGRDFDAFAAEVGRFLTFKQLPPPGRAVFELVLHGAGGAVEPRDLWAVVNLGEDPVVVGLPGLRLRLGPGEGCLLPEDVAAEALPPEGEVPDVLLVVRRPARGPGP
jgi:hypothetical protein